MSATISVRSWRKDRLVVLETGKAEEVLNARRVGVKELVNDEDRGLDVGDLRRRQDKQVRSWPDRT